MYDPASKRAEEFIAHEEITETLAQARRLKDDKSALEGILAKARERKGLTHREASVLLACDDPERNREILDLAYRIKQEFYGNRIVLFAPLYLSNYCVNACLYCPYHYGSGMARKKLTQGEIYAETAALQSMGHKRLAIEAGEDPVNNPIEYILESIATIYSVKRGNGAIRRVNVNIAATTVENYRKLRDAQVGTYILFQETYHRDRYEKLHPRGPKHNYAYHTEAMDRAMEGGIDDVGIGALFGLENYAYEFAGELMHAEHLEALHGVGPHTISLPRVKPAQGVDPGSFEGGVSDALFEKIAACIRIALPYTGMIISTRESREVRERALRAGVSQISGASRTSVGGYAGGGGVNDAAPDDDTRQFEVSDTRTLDEVILWLIDAGYIPSFCTACYRNGRTGDRFMSLAKAGQIKNVCLPNALMTLCEYAMDYGDGAFRDKAAALVRREAAGIANETIRRKTAENIDKIMTAGERDFFV